MRVTTVRVEGGVKEELDRVQGLVLAETGQRVSQSELLARLLRIARRHEAELMTAGEEAWRPPTHEEFRRLRERVRDLGIETDSSRIDEELYGGSPHE